MSLLASPNAQRGATLVVGLIMLLLITLVVSSAFTLSGTNLKSVGNMQLRDEAIAAANIATEVVLGSPFTNAPAAQSITVDLNNDGTDDYAVEMATPECIRATVSGDAPVCDEEFKPCPSNTWNTVWKLSATVTDPASGASSMVHSGVRVLLTQSQCDAICPPAITTPATPCS